MECHRADLGGVSFSTELETSARDHQLPAGVAELAARSATNSRCARPSGSASSSLISALLSTLQLRHLSPSAWPGSAGGRPPDVASFASRRTNSASCRARHSRTRCFASLFRPFFCGGSGLSYESQDLTLSAPSPRSAAPQLPHHVRDGKPRLSSSAAPSEASRITPSERASSSLLRTVSWSGRRGARVGFTPRRRPAHRDRFAIVIAILPCRYHGGHSAPPSVS